MRETKNQVLLLIIAFLIVIIAILSWQKSLLVPAPAPQDFQTTKLQQQGTSDEISAIERDLETTDLSDLDRELEDIERELSSF